MNNKTEMQLSKEGVIAEFDGDDLTLYCGDYGCNNDRGCFSFIELTRADIIKLAGIYKIKPSDLDNM